MTDKVFLDEKVYPIEKAELHLVPYDNSFMMYLGVSTDGEAGGFGLWEVELPLLKSIEELGSQRIHVKPDGECYDDDTLGTDMVGAYATSDLNYWGGQNESYVYGEITVDFKRIEGWTFQIHIELTLTDSNKDTEDLPPEAFNHRGSADFIVTADDKDPWDD